MSKYIKLEDAKQHLRVDFADDDAYITSLISMVEMAVEIEIGDNLAELSKKTYHTGTCDTTAGSNEVDIGGTWIENELDGYYIALEDDYKITANTVAGVLTLDNDMEVTDTDVSYQIWNYDQIPERLRQSMLLMLGHFYLVREPVIVGVGVVKVPYGFDWLIAPFKNWTIQ